MTLFSLLFYIKKNLYIFAIIKTFMFGLGFGLKLNIIVARQIITSLKQNLTKLVTNITDFFFKVQ